MLNDDNLLLLLSYGNTQRNQNSSIKKDLRVLLYFLDYNGLRRVKKLQIFFFLLQGQDTSRETLYSDSKLRNV